MGALGCDEQLKSSAAVFFKKKWAQVWIRTWIAMQQAPCFTLPKQGCSQNLTPERQLMLDSPVNGHAR